MNMIHKWLLYYADILPDKYSNLPTINRHSVCTQMWATQTAQCNNTKGWLSEERSEPSSDGLLNQSEGVWRARPPSKLLPSSTISLEGVCVREVQHCPLCIVRPSLVQTQIGYLCFCDRSVAILFCLPVELKAFLSLFCRCQLVKCLCVCECVCVCACVEARVSASV